MNVIEHRGARASSALARIGQAMVQVLDSLDDKHNPYSPAVCVSALLLIGLAVKLGPALHALH